MPDEHGGSGTIGFDYTLELTETASNTDTFARTATCNRTLSETASNTDTFARAGTVDYGLSVVRDEVYDLSVVRDEVKGKEGYFIEQTATGASPF